MVVVKALESLTQEDIEVFIRYPRMDQRVTKLIELAKSVDDAIKCSQDSAVVWIRSADILYAESVDKHTFVYVKDGVHRTEMRLYQLLEQLTRSGFVQVSKFCLVNLYHLEGIKTLANSHMEGTLKNGERVTITRKFIPHIKKRLLEK